MMKKIAIILLAVLSLTMVMTFATAYAAESSIQHLKDLQFDISDTLTAPGQSTADFEGGDPIVNVIIKFINFALAIIGSLAIILFIIAGFQIMLAQGNQQKLDDAKSIAINAVIGLVITFLAYIIVIFVQSIFI